MYRNHMKNNILYSDGRMYRLVPTAKKSPIGRKILLILMNLKKRFITMLSFTVMGANFTNVEV